MPHLGKLWPRQWKHFLQLAEQAHAVGPSRKITLHGPTGTPTGSVALAWAGLTVVSAEADWSTDDESFIRHTVTHPSNSDYTIDVDTRLEVIEPLPTVAPFMWYRMIYRPRDAGTQLCWRETFVSLTFAWTGSFTPSTVGPTWLDKIDTGRWNLATLSRNASTWDDQPEYQPYRTNPF